LRGKLAEKKINANREANNKCGYCQAKHHFTCMCFKFYNIYGEKGVKYVEKLLEDIKDINKLKAELKKKPSADKVNAA